MNNYHIYDEIGRGKSSIVYKGRKKKTIEYLAVKSVEKHRRTKILNEVRIMHTLDHENILKFYNWYETKNHLWIIFEYCAGGSLLSLIEQDKKINEEAVRSFGIDLVKALLYLHTSGIIFSDLKPSNILFTEYGVLKLADFGLTTRIIDLVQEKDPQNKKGTPFYMAPELFQEDGVHSFYSDLWSLGCVLYELASGQPPFVSNFFQDLVAKIATETIPVLSDMSKEFNNLLNDLLQKDCSKRISWEELVLHPFWQSRLVVGNLEFPPQPLYEKYLKTRLLTQRSLSFRRDSGIFQPKIDVLRISQNLHKNLLREGDETGYCASGNEGKDIQLNDKDQVVDFGEHKEKEEKDNENEGFGEKSERFSEKSNGEKDEEEEVYMMQDELASQREFRPVTIQAKPRETSMLVEEDKPGHHRANSAQTAAYIKPTNKPPPISELIFQTSDYTVKPIIGNRDVEKPTEVAFVAQTLGLLPWSTEDIHSNSDSQKLEEHFHTIYTCLTSQSTASDKTNLLNYFESIIINSSVANKLINSAFVTLFVKLLKSAKNSAVKIRTCSIVGQMIRHATLINPELSSCGLFQTLSEQLRDKNDKVRKKAMSALGEYLFYAATQMDENTGSDWDIPTGLYTTVVKISKTTDDEIFRFYACKTIENICAQSKKAGSKFASPEVAQNLLSIFLTTKSDNFRVSAVVGLTHVLRLNSSLAVLVTEKLSIKIICQKLSEDQQRVQQALLTILLTICANSQPKFTNLLAEDKNFCKLLIELFESSNIVIRGKALLVMCFLIKSSKALGKIAENKLFSVLDKLVRDSYKYVQNCLTHVLDSLNEITLSSLKQLVEDLNLTGNSSIVPLLPTIQQILTSSSVKSRLYYPTCIKSLCELVQSCKNLPNEISQQILMLLEAFSSHGRSLGLYAETIVSSLLPMILAQKTSDDTDIRFRSLKVFSDIIIIFLYDDSIYDQSNLGKVTTKMINDLLVKQLIPSIKEYLDDQDPIPLYAQKLLSAIVERCIAFLRIVKIQNLFPVLLENFSGGNPKLNLHLVSIVKKIIESQENTLEELVQMGVINKVNSVMKVIFEQDWCVEKMLDILYELLFLAADSVRGKKVNQDFTILKITEALSDNFVLCTKILKFMNEPV